MAFLVMAVAVLAGCEKDPGGTSTYTTAVQMAGGIFKQLDDSGHKTFAEGERMAVIYTNTSQQRVKAVSNALTGSDISNSGKGARFTVELTDPDKNQPVTYIYPAAMAKSDGTVNYDALATQDGSLANLAQTLDLCTYSGGWSGTALPTDVALDNQLAVCKFSVKGSDGTTEIAGSITQFVVDDGSHTYTVNREAADGPIYVAMRPVTGDITFTATAGSYHYVRTVTGKTLAASHMYPVDLTMLLSQTFSYTGSSQTLTVPTTGWYTIQAYGAEGGKVIHIFGEW